MSGEESLKQNKVRRRRLLLGIIATVLMVVIAGAAYYVSNQLSSRAGIAPTGPLQPFAAGGCTNNPAQCKAGKETCVNGVCKPIAPTPTGYGTGYTCTTTNCPSPCFKCNAAKTSCISLGCAGVSSTGIAGQNIALPIDEGAPRDANGNVINHCGSTCPAADCHCLGGDACTGYECRSDTRISCGNQGRSWCINMTGKAMTCCAVGYVCNPSGNGCVSSGGSTTTPKPTKTSTPTPTKTTTTPSPTKTPTPTPTPVVSCTAIDYSIQQTDGSWKNLTSAELSAEAKPGSRIKFAVTAKNTTQVDIKINDANWGPTILNSTTGKFEYIYNIPAAGSYTIVARYLMLPAANLVFGQDNRCKGNFTAATTCVLTPPIWSDWSDCTKSCGGGTQTRTCTEGSCGGALNCDEVDGGNSEKACNTQSCESNVSIDKKAYQDEADNSSGNYSLTQEIDTVSKNQTFVYTIQVSNNAADKADGVKITDPLTGLNQDKLTFLDKEAVCEYSSPEKMVVCNTSLDPGETKEFSFRSTVSDAVVNGTVIKNIATVTYLGKILKAEKDLLVSTIVSCNHTCTSDTECGDGLLCDTETNKCRNNECSNITSCVCPKPTERTASVPTRVPATRAPRPTALPEAGIFDFAGVAAFGGGLILTIVGILLAL